jgi:hypothetical protein
MASPCEKIHDNKCGCIVVNIKKPQPDYMASYPKRQKPL